MIGFFCVISSIGYSQNIIKAEYFFNNDPGFGNGIAFTSNLNSTTITNITEQVNVSSLPNGINNLYTRVLDENGHWSITNSKSFLKLAQTTVSNIVAAEYFFNADPGFGAGNPLTIVKNGNTIASYIQTLDISGLPNGINSVYVRALDANGHWSITNSISFLKLSQPKTGHIVSAEYFFNADPGFGSGNPLTIGNNGNTITSYTKTLDISSLPSGINTVYVRVLDDNGHWSITNSISFLKLARPNISNITSAEYFFNSDPGFGNGNPLSLSNNSNTISGYTQSIDVRSLANGVNTVYVRVLDADGHWSITNSISFLKIKQPDISNIIYGEYFFNNDPGFHNGEPLNVVAGGNTINNLTQSVDVSKLPIGKNTLYVRFLDNVGNWSITNSTSFLKAGNPQTLSYSGGPYTFYVNTPITNITPTYTGITPVTYSVSPNLPDGLTIESNTGVIDGTPTVLSAVATYVITAANAGGNYQTAIKLKVIASTKIESFDPTSASSDTSITISGTGFTGATAVSFGSVAAKSFKVIDDNTITAIVGKGASGDVSVITPTGNSSLGGFTYKPPPNYTWTGATSNDWSLATNWTNDVLPTSANAVTIPSKATNQPILLANTTIGAMVLNGQLDLNGKTVTLNGAVSGSGSFISDVNSTMIIDGKIGTINFDALNNTIKDLTITSGSAALGRSLNVVGIFTPTSGIFNTNDSLTLKSTSITNTALVGVVGGTVLGKITVERYIPKGLKAFRQLCTGGVYNVGTMYDNWQESGDRPSGYGMYVFGLKGTSWSVDASTGLDITAGGFASMYDYTDYMKYSPILNTKVTQLDPYKGYYGVVYGDRTANTFSNFDASTSMNAATTIRTTGTLVTGTVTYSTNGVAGNYNSSVTKLFPLADTGTLIANPYAATIDWHSVTKTNMSSSCWYVDPTFLNNNYQVPVAYNAIAGTNSNTKSNIGRYIQPGQGFWVFTDATNNTTRELIFHESDKAINAKKTDVFGTANKPNRISVGIWKSGKNLDGAVAVFKNGFSKAYQSEDSKKLYSNGENIFIQEASRALCIDGLPTPQNNDVINLQFSNLKKDSSYQLKLDVTEFSATGIQAYLVDNLLKKQTAITDSTIVSFVATNNVSYQNRFNILFKPATPLSVQFIAVKGQLVESNIAIQFTTANEVNIANYTIEKSINGTDFKAVNVQVAQNENAATYNWLDKQVSAVVNYYRIKATEVNGATSYSKTIVVNNQAVKGAITIFPNPIKDRSFNVFMNNVASGNYHLNVYDITGKLVMKTSIKHASEVNSQSITMKQTLTKGSYLVKLSNDAGNVYQTKLVVE